jgi:hypothetical protein
MPDRPANPDKLNQDTSPEQIEETQLNSLGEFTVEHRDSPPQAAPNQKIHPRLPLPLVPGARPQAYKEGKDDV